MLELLIARREEQVPGIVVLELVDPDGGALPPFEAGAHVDLQVSPGVIRQYSLCGNPADRNIYRLGVLLDPAFMNAFMPACVSGLVHPAICSRLWMLAVPS